MSALTGEREVGMRGISIDTGKAPTARAESRWEAHTI